MTNLLIFYVAAFFLPLLFHSWRVAVLGLGVQGLLLAMILATGHEDWAWPETFEFVSLVVIRGLFIPWYLFRQMRGYDTAPQFSLVSKNLVQWTIAFGMLAMAFLFGHKISPGDPQEALQVGTAAGSILIAMLVLANQNHPLGQIVGLFTFEGGLTLVELLSPHAMPFPVSVGVTIVSVIFVLVCGQYLRQILAIPPGSKDVEVRVEL